jgi:hypothetical protein
LHPLAFANCSELLLIMILAIRASGVADDTRSRNSATRACGSLNSLLNTSRPIAFADAAMYFSIGTI